MSSDSTRDRALEHLLSTASPPTSEPSVDCLSADVIAAWAEGGLAPDEHRAVEQHLASCARCQAVVAVFARTVPEVRPAPVLAFWQKPVVRWALPIGTAAAAALAVTIFLREPDAPSSIGTQARVEPSMADAVPAPATPPAREQGLQSPDQASRADERAAAPADNRLERAASDEARERQNAAPAAAAPKALPSPPPPAPPAVQVTAPTAPAPAQPSERVFQETAAVPTQPGSPAAAARAGDATQPFIRMALSEPPVVVVRSPDQTVRWRIVRWQIERAARLQMLDPSGRGAGRLGGRAEAASSSADTEAIGWVPVTLEQPAPVVAGSAPMPTVAWFVGARGLVVRTTDGSNFTRIALPDTENLVSVEATSAEHAVVTTTTGRRYETSNGGLTWIAR